MPPQAKLSLSWAPNLPRMKGQAPAWGRRSNDGARLGYDSSGEPEQDQRFGQMARASGAPGIAARRAEVETCSSFAERRTLEHVCPMAYSLKTSLFLVAALLFSG